MATPTLSAPIASEQITLTKIRKAMSLRLGSTLTESMQISVQDYIGERIIRAAFDVLADKIAEDTYTTRFTWKTPKTAWQMFKKAHAPKWFNRRYPVQYEHHTYKRLVKFTRYAEYPRANVISQEPKYISFYNDTLGGLEVIRDQVEDLN